MPRVNFGDLTAPGATYRALVIVSALLRWPNDAPARDEFLATVMAQNLATLKRSASDLPDPAKASDWVETIKALEEIEAWHHTKFLMGNWFEESGSYGAVAAAPGLAAFDAQCARDRKRWFSAGATLGLLRRLAMHHANLRGGASVNKAIYIITRLQPPFALHNDRDLRAAWSSCKTVLHFCAALFDTFMIACEAGGTPDVIGAEVDRMLREEFLEFLALADSYQEFALTYSSARAKSAPILLEDAWLLPSRKQWPRTVREWVPLPQEALDIAKDRKSVV